MKTRIFKVIYSALAHFGKEPPVRTTKEQKIVAKNALDVLENIKATLDKGEDYFDDDTGENVKVTYSQFDPTYVEIIAESDE